jgi:hypothetical protein
MKVPIWEDMIRKASVIENCGFAKKVIFLKCIRCIKKNYETIERERLECLKTNWNIQLSRLKCNGCARNVMDLTQKNKEIALKIF